MAETDYLIEARSALDSPYHTERDHECAETLDCFCGAGLRFSCRHKRRLRMSFKDSFLEQEWGKLGCTEDMIPPEASDVLLRLVNSSRRSSKACSLFDTCIA